MARRISWSQALRDLKHDRAKRNDVREERLKTTAGLRGNPALALSAWRGRSGRRYVVGVHEPCSLVSGGVGGSVIVAVCRDENGFAIPLRVAAFEWGDDSAFIRWVKASVARGATELHAHRLADNEDERKAVVADLCDRTEEPAL